MLLRNQTVDALYWIKNSLSALFKEENHETDESDDFIYINTASSAC